MGHPQEPPQGDTGLGDFRGPGDNGHQYRWRSTGRLLGEYWVYWKGYWEGGSTSQPPLQGSEIRENLRIRVTSTGESVLGDTGGSLGGYWNGYGAGEHSQEDAELGDSRGHGDKDHQYG